jgi:hypothetical protein
MYKKVALLVFLLLASRLFGMTADEAYPEIEPTLASIPAESGTLYTVTDQDMTVILNKASDVQINLFGLLDCVYRYAKLSKKRVEILGITLQKAQSIFNYGGYPIDVLLPIERIIKIEVGAPLKAGQNPLDITLNEPYSVYIEVATAIYDVHCGFTKMEPQTFLESYGMYMKKWNITKPIWKIYLGPDNLGSVYVQGFSFISKKFVFNSVSRIPQAE